MQQPTYTYQQSPQHIGTTTAQYYPQSQHYVQQEAQPLVM
jgi:hypothetical protein